MSSQTEQIKARLGIVDVVQSYLKLQKAGANFKANCPFHNEKTPSFFVSPSRESWHCFGCNKGGDIFAFVMEIEGMEFLDALKSLASRAGVELAPVNREAASERSRLFELMDAAKIFYERGLKGNKELIEYLKNRGLKGETAKAFGIGYAAGPSAAGASGWSNLCDFLKSRGFSGEEMEKAGMAIKSQKSNLKSQKYYDRFRDRIMFPLNNSSGRVVGFSGRIFGAEGDKTGKYINTPQTILYDKSRILYGFDKAKNEIRKKDLCVLVEGQMDVIMSHQAGLANTVAVSGTALTSEHLKAIKRLAGNLVMAFDGDEAGLRAALRGIDMALAEGFEVKAALVPPGKDPADMAKEDPEKWREAVENAKHIIAFYLESFSDRKDIEEIVLPRLAALPSEIEKAKWIKETADKLGIGEEPVWDEVRKIKLSPPEREAPEKDRKPLGSGARTRLQMLKERLEGLIEWKKDTEDKELKRQIEDIAEKHGLAPGDGKENLAFMAELFYNEVDDLKKELDVLAANYGREKIKSEMAESAKKIRAAEAAGDEERVKKHMNEFNELNKKLMA